MKLGLEIVFKYVGAGDSIIVNWDDQIGIIDCKSNEGNNPIIEELSIRNINKIEFILLSHPHLDHYSGLIDLFDFCLRNSVQIDRFITTTQINKSFLDALLISTYDKDKLANTVRKAIELNRIGLLDKIGIVDNSTPPFKMNNSLEFEILSPSITETTNFAKNSIKQNTIIKKSSSLNIISSVVRIKNNSHYILLTADAEKPTLKRIGLSTLKNEKIELILGQVPHHGSINNHYKEFWKRRKRIANPTLAISVGPNKNNKNPSSDVISELSNLGYVVQCTWNSSNSVSNKSTKLNSVSKKISSTNNSPNQDLRYVL